MLTRRQRLTRTVTVVSTIVIIVIVLAVVRSSQGSSGGHPAPAAQPPPFLSALSSAVGTAVGTAPSAATAAGRAVGTAVGPAVGGASSAGTSRADASTATSATIRRPTDEAHHHVHLPKISAFGDSVMLGAKPDMLHVFPGGRVDAVEARQAIPTLAAAQAAARKGRLYPLVIIHTGTNGTLEPSDLKKTLRVVSVAVRVKRILVLTVHVPQPWQRPNNQIIKRVTRRFRLARIVNWNNAAKAHPSWLYDDHTHLTPEGQEGYAHLLKKDYIADR